MPYERSVELLAVFMIDRVAAPSFEFRIYWIAIKHRDTFSSRISSTPQFFTESVLAGLVR